MENSNILDEYKHMGYQVTIMSLNGMIGYKVTDPYGEILSEAMYYYSSQAARDAAEGAIRDNEAQMEQIQRENQESAEMD